VSSSKKQSKKRGPAASKAAKGTPPKSRKPDARKPDKKPATKAAAPRPAPRPVPLDLPAPKPLPAKPAVPAPRPGIRLSGSGSSRLTIKPSPQQGPRPALQLSTKVRPGGQRKLSEVELDEDEVLIDGFDAVLRDEKVRITAVLERTCVYVDRNGVRQLARKEELLVEADKLPIRRRGVG
jgi:hypothetical protein